MLNCIYSAAFGSNTSAKTAIILPMSTSVRHQFVQMPFESILFCRELNSLGLFLTIQEDFFTKNLIFRGIWILLNFINPEQFYGTDFVLS